MSAGPILFERQGEIAIITLDDPERMNPFSRAMQDGLTEMIELVRQDKSIGALVLTGAGRAFCSGADLSAKPEPLPPGTTRGQRTARRMHEFATPLILALRSLPVPLIAAVNGAAAGAGIGLALCADVVVAARSAYFYLPFMPKLGILPDCGTTWFLERLVGPARAAALALLGQRLPAETAAAWGMIAEYTDDERLRTRALELATQLAQLPVHAISEARLAFEAAASNTLEQQLGYEADRQGALLDSPEYEEGVAAFREKRQPRFARRG